MELLELYNYAEASDIDIDEFPMGSISSQSQMELDGSCHIAIDTRQFHTVAEEKAALAHEVGHCTTGSFYNRYSPYDIRARHERTADKKAVYILVPLDELMDAVESPWNSVYDLSERFGVPESIMRKALEIYEQDLRNAFADCG